jgi:hypothetical protein
VLDSAAGDFNAITLDMILKGAHENDCVDLRHPRHGEVFRDGDVEYRGRDRS